MQSVLQQTTNNHVSLSSQHQQPPEQCDVVSSSREQEHVCSACGLARPAASTELEPQALSQDSATAATTGTATTAAGNALQTDVATPVELRPKPLLAAIKKQGVSAESSVQSKQQSYSATIPKYDKDFR